MGILDFIGDLTLVEITFEGFDAFTGFGSESSSFAKISSSFKNFEFLVGETAITGFVYFLDGIFSSLTVGIIVCLLDLFFGLTRSWLDIELLLDLVILPTDLSSSKTKFSPAVNSSS